MKNYWKLQCRKLAWEVRSYQNQIEREPKNDWLRNDLSKVFAAFEDVCREYYTKEEALADDDYAINILAEQIDWSK